jgi:hypothetical protein
MITSPIYEMVQNAPLNTKLKIVIYFLALLLMLSWTILLGIIARSHEQASTAPAVSKTAQK